MRHCLSPQATSRARTHGFALIIAISLMAMIFLLLVSLSQLIQIETKVGTTQNQVSLARQNAVLGLSSAIGRLQRIAGPDQRVTATAALLDASPDDGENITGVNEPYWTGVWNSKYPDGVSVLNSGGLANYRNLNRRDPDGGATFLGWLVSGNDNVDPTTFDREGGDAVMLVGEGSVDDEDIDGVYANKVTVRNADTNDLTGHFAYWVGDEGVKARFDAVDEHLTPEVASPVNANVEQGKLSMLVAQRVGVENAIDLNFAKNKDEGKLDRAASQHQLELLEYNGTGDGHAETEAKGAFHDVSLYSAGVLSNVRDGGLKKDLTAFFEANTGSALPASMPAFDRNDVYEFTSTGVNVVNDEKGIADFPDQANPFSPGSPSWDQLRAFSKLKDRPTASVTPRLRNATLAGDYPVGPVLIRAELTLVPEFTNRVEQPTGEITYDFNVHIAVRAELWNPYNAPLADHDYEIEFMVKDAAAKLLPVIVKNGTTLDSSGDYPSGTFKELLTPGSSDKGVSSSMRGVFQHANVTSYKTDDPDGDDTVTGFVFKLSSGTLQPGQTVVYSLSSGSSAAYDEDNLEVLTAINDIGTVDLPYGQISVPASLIEINTSNGELIEPYFVWRNWNALGEDPTGVIASMALLEPVDTDADPDARNLFDSSTSQVVGLDRYYSRLHDVPVTRIGLADATPSSVRLNDLNLANPAASHAFSLIGYEYAIDQLDANFPTNEEPVMLTHNNAMARDIGPSGMDPDAITDTSYIVPGWGGALGYARSNWAGTNNHFGSSYSNSGVASAVVADLPSKDIPILSLGWLQHARLIENSQSPTFLIGNSMPNVYISDLTALEREDDADYDADANTREPAVVDATYLINDALWDPYFLSTVETPSDLNTPTYVPANSRLGRITYGGQNIPNAQLNDFFDFAAANLMVEGAFNVNSVSVDAWKAFLGSLSGLEIDPEDGVPNDGNPLDRVFTHLAYPTQGEDVANTQNDLWNGYRSLTEPELTDLAEQMVRQVKARGPFFSLAEFVNRRLSNDVTGQRGALQAAIDASSINQSILSNAGTDGQTNSLPAPFLQGGSQGYHYDATTGWITQGDILQALGPMLSARSDTFLIRAYGDAVDPLTQQVKGQAWCEAVVQRMPAPVERASDSEDNPDYYEPSNPDQLGRQFKIIAFRWLRADQV